MGGKAFGQIADPIRVSTFRMEPIARAVASVIGAGLVRWPTDKRDHGDIDLVVPASLATGLGDAELAARAASAAGYDFVYRRPHLSDPILFVGLHLPEGLLQVDLLCVSDDLLDFATRYLSWGDTGSMIGRTAREMGLSFGQTGLRCPIRVAGAVKESVLLTTSFDDALAFLGWDAAVHDAGFANDGEIADFIASGLYFDPKVYEASRTSSAARRRGRVRTGRDAFIADVTSRPSRFDWPAAKGPSPMQEHFTAKALDHFGKADEVAQVASRLEESLQRLPTALTAPAVLLATGAPAEDVRAIISIMKEAFATTDAFNAWKLLCTTADVVRDAQAAYEILQKRQLIEAAARAKGAV